MQVLAAGFASRTDAALAGRELRDALDLGDADLRLANLGGDAGQAGYAAVLGGRFRSDQIAFAQEVLERHGGVILTAVPEAWMGANARGSLAK
jgi:hypothetical protein